MIRVAHCLEEAMRSLNCIEVPGGSTFVVDIDDGQTVHHLKQAIKHNNMYDYPANRLKLYLAKRDNEWLKCDDSTLDQLKTSNATDGLKAIMKEPMNPLNHLKSFNFPDVLSTDVPLLHIIVDTSCAAQVAMPLVQNVTTTNLGEVDLLYVWRLSGFDLNSLPKVENSNELETLLLRPLPFKLMGCSFLSPDIFQANGELINCPPLLHYLYVAADTLRDSCSENASENEWQKVHDTLMSVTKMLCRGTSFNLQMPRNTADTTTTHKMRADQLVMHKGLVLMRCEEKSFSSSIFISLKELTDKMRPWNPMFYGNLPYILGYATSGHIIQIVAIDRSCRQHNILTLDTNFELTKTFKIFCNLAFFFYEMARHSKFKQPSLLRPYMPLYKPNKTIELRDRYIKRTIKGKDTQDYLRLVDIYEKLKELRESSDISHLQTISDIERHDDKIILVLKLLPLGMHHPPENHEEVLKWLKDLLTALRFWHQCNYCHGDLRWSNIIYVPTLGHWVLIDMDESYPPDSKIIDWNHQCYGQRLNFHHDLYQLGVLLSELSLTLNPRLQSICDQLLSCKTNNMLTANTILINLGM